MKVNQPVATGLLKGLPLGYVGWKKAHLQPPYFPGMPTQSRWGTSSGFSAIPRGSFHSTSSAISNLIYSPKYFNCYGTDFECGLWRSGVHTRRKRRRPLQLGLMLDIIRPESFPISHSWEFVTLKVPSSETRMGAVCGTAVHIGPRYFCIVARPRKSPPWAVCFRPRCRKLYVALRHIAEIFKFFFD